MHYNFARVHQTLRVTPAMAAGVSDHVWNIEEIIFCNDSPYFVFPGDTPDTIVLEKMDELARVDYARHCPINTSYNEYREGVYWHTYEVGGVIGSLK